MILCVGTPGSGKTLLLRCLAANAAPDSVNRTIGTTPTTGTDIVTIVKPNVKRPDFPDVVKVAGRVDNNPPVVNSFRRSGRLAAPWPRYGAPTSSLGRPRCCTS